MKNLTIIQNIFKLVASTCWVYRSTYWRIQMITSRWHCECDISQRSMNNWLRSTAIQLRGLRGSPQRWPWHRNYEVPVFPAQSLSEHWHLFLNFSLFLVSTGFSYGISLLIRTFVRNTNFHIKVKMLWLWSPDFEYFWSGLFYAGTVFNQWSTVLFPSTQEMCPDFIFIYSINMY